MFFCLDFGAVNNTTYDGLSRRIDVKSLAVCTRLHEVIDARTTPVWGGFFLLEWLKLFLPICSATNQIKKMYITEMYERYEQYYIVMMSVPKTVIFFIIQNNKLELNK